jgi:F-type H+-transporting ATPase subunit delta
MSSLTTLARPYAKAAFELANNDNGLAAWDELLVAASAVTADESMTAWLQSPHSNAEKAVAIIGDAIGGELDARFEAYLNVLALNDRLALCGEISRMFQLLRQEAEKRLQVRVVSAVSLEDSQIERIKAALAKRFDREITLNNDVEPGVLGGAIIYAGDQVIDGSLIGRLNRLESSLS